MKKFVYLLILFLSSSMFGQLTDEQQKTIIKQMKTQTPEQYLQNLENSEASRVKIKELEAKIDALNLEKETLQAEILEYKAATVAQKQSIKDLEKMRHDAEVAMARHSCVSERISPDSSRHLA